MSKQLKIISKNEVAILEQIDREKVKSQIYEVRGLSVMLDSDIAAYFGVTTGNLNKAKNRNIQRFPENFCFTLSDHEISLFQFGIPMQTKGIKGGRSNNPTVYTEHGIAMLTSVLHTPRAVAASIQIKSTTDILLLISEQKMECSIIVVHPAKTQDAKSRQ